MKRFSRRRSYDGIDGGQRDMLFGGDMNKLGAAILVACGLHCVACGPESSESEDAPYDEDPVVLAQSDQGAPPKVSAEQSTTVLPDQLNDTPSAAFLQITVTDMKGSHCALDRSLVGNDPKAASLTFTGGDFKIQLPKAPTMTPVAKTIDCQIVLRVSGIPANSRVKATIGYSGTKSLPWDSSGLISSTVTWRDADFSNGGRDFLPIKIEDGYSSWTKEHRTEATATSKCFTNDTQDDTLYVDFSLLVTSQNPDLPSLVAFNSVGATAETATTRAPVAAQFTVTPCKPGT